MGAARIGEGTWSRAPTNTQHGQQLGQPQCSTTASSHGSSKNSIRNPPNAYTDLEQNSSLSFRAGFVKRECPFTVVADAEPCVILSVPSSSPLGHSTRFLFRMMRSTFPWWQPIIVMAVATPPVPSSLHRFVSLQKRSAFPLDLSLWPISSFLKSNPKMGFGVPPLNYYRRMDSLLRGLR